ncbi:hypothetical protein H6P81_010900 [Aristolochia fimbriata]|uniref:Cytochrome P450 n=1 Tax=Aristolochia fimbriata TaxID=158543 RepID=A0AAV7EQ29_ARIFI|nr:hypothetical protein H6P81_010900 [Aristolochia fimbriata]
MGKGKSQVRGRWTTGGGSTVAVDRPPPSADERQADPRSNPGRDGRRVRPLVTVWIGLRRAVVASNWEMAKEVLATKDKALASRPLNAAGKYLGMDYTMLGFAPNGDYWRQGRKLTTLELLSPRQLELLKDVRAQELDLAMNDLYKHYNNSSGGTFKLVDMKAWCGDLGFNNILMAVVGKRYFGTNKSEDEVTARRFQKALIDFFIQSGKPVPSDAIPFLEWLDVGGHIRAMKKTAKELDSIATIWLKERRERMASGEPNGPARDFLDVMLNLKDQSHFTGLDPDSVMKATCLTLILAATDAMSTTLTWALALLVSNRHALKKAQEEIDAVVGKERKVNESDVKNFPYIWAIVKETLRMYPVFQTTGTHLAMEDCELGGYKVPKGTTVLVNLWKVQRDPTVWPEPLKFQPERFLTEKGEPDIKKGQNFEFIPFSGGRRKCPGGPFALQVIHLALARLLHEFDLTLPSDEPIDMTESLGLTNPKATPLQVLLTPASPSPSPVKVVI